MGAVLAVRIAVIPLVELQIARMNIKDVSAGGGDAKARPMPDSDAANVVPGVPSRGNRGGYQVTRLESGKRLDTRRGRSREPVGIRTTAFAHAMPLRLDRQRPHARIERDRRTRTTDTGRVDPVRLGIVQAGTVHLRLSTRSGFHRQSCIAQREE